MSELFITKITSEGFFASVNSSMFNQVLVGYKCSMTSFTFITFSSSVNTSMLVQIETFGKLLIKDFGHVVFVVRASG